MLRGVEERSDFSEGSCWTIRGRVCPDSHLCAESEIHHYGSTLWWIRCHDTRMVGYTFTAGHRAVLIIANAWGSPDALAKPPLTWGIVALDETNRCIEWSSIWNTPLASSRTSLQFSFTIFNPGLMVSSPLSFVWAVTPMTLINDGTCLMVPWMLYGLRIWTQYWMTIRNSASAPEKSSSLAAWVIKSFCLNGWHH